jgi:adenylate cyclase
VNIAARLQDATKELNNSFIISSEAFMLLTEKPKGFTVTTVHLRGLAGPREVFLLGTTYRPRT